MLLRDRPDLGYSVSATTRPIRRGERNGVDYYFIPEQEFQRGIERGAFLEWALYGGHLYGTLEDEVDRVLREQKHVVLDIEVQGARQIQQRRRDVVSIFVLPPSAEVLLQRLRKREREDDAQIHQRLLRAVEELRETTAYDYVVINDELERAVADISAIIDAESRKVERLPQLRERIAELQKGLGRAATALAPK
jgi:guanylate kinase